MSCGPMPTLVDVGLPDGDGLELARRNRRAAVVPAGAGHVVRRRRGLERRAPATSGAVGFVPKTELATGSLHELLAGVT